MKLRKIVKKDCNFDVHIIKTKMNKKTSSREEVRGKKRKERRVGEGDELSDGYYQYVSVGRSVGSRQKKVSYIIVNNNNNGLRKSAIGMFCAAIKVLT